MFKRKQNSTFLRLMHYLKRYKWLTFLSFVFLVAMSVTESLIPLVAREFIDLYIATNAVSKGLWFIAGYYLLNIVHIVLTYIGTVLFSKVSFSIVNDIRQDVFENVTRLGMRYYDQVATGTIISRVTNDTETIATMFNGLLTNVVRAIFIFSATLYTMLFLDIRLTSIVILFLPLIFVSMWLYRKLSESVIMTTRQKLGELNARLAESIDGMKIIQVFNQEQRLLDEFDTVNGEHLYYANRSINLDSLLLRPAMSLLQLLAYTVIALYFGLNWEDSAITAGLVYAFLQYINRLFNPIIQVTHNFSTLQTSMVSAKRVFQLIDRTDYEPVQLGTVDSMPNGDVSFENVSFSYDGETPVLKNVSFTVKKGETIAFVGHTGSGKSSIINVLMRFYDFQEGNVTIDGHPIQSFTEQTLRQNVGLVLQEPFLFHGTVASNIKMYQNISDQAVKDAAVFVDADQFIQQLPQQYNAVVSERGSTFSTGQRQLLAFARTIATQPKILILDEATANIDSETEEIIQRSLHKMRQGRTTIAIAHRLSTIQDANCIYVLHKGEIIERGTHEELLQKQGQYFEMYQLQSGNL